MYEKLKQVQVHSSQNLEMFENRMWVGCVDISKMVKYDMDCVQKPEKLYESSFLKDLFFNYT